MNEPQGQNTTPDRRSLLKGLIHTLGTLFATILGLPALAFLIDARNRAAPSGDFKSVGRLKELAIGVPHQVVIHDVRRDAWTLHPSDVIGRVWLIRRDQDRVEVFTTICPHLGCPVNYQENEKLFVCPCHGGTFDLDGKRVERPGLTNPAPRGMDQLPVQRDPADPEIIQVKYQNFVQGMSTPVAKT